MASIISSGTTSGTALNMSGDTSGVLQLATNGTTTALTLDASQNATFAGTLTTTGITNSGVATGARFNPTGSSVTGNGMYLPAANSLGLSTNGTNAVYIDSSQNVGIGTASPTQKLTVAGSSSLGTASASGNTAIFQSPGSLYLTLNTNGTLSGARRNWAVSPEADVAGALSIACGASEGASPTSPKMIITSGGDVRIGTTSDMGGKLNVDCTTGNSFGAIVKSNTSGGAALAVNAQSPCTTHVQWYNSGTATGTVTTNGASAVSYNTTSDYRLKENIASMTGALAKVAQLKPCTYKWKLDGASGQGFIAHELAEVVPDCVTGEKDAIETYTDEDGNEQTRIKPQGIDTSYLVATLTAAIKELKAINDTQAETINAQSATLVALTARVTALEGN